MIKPAYPHPPIAREGWPYVAAVFALALATTLLWSLAAGLVFWLLGVVVLLCLRDPARLAPDSTQAVLSPADGRVVAVETVRDEHVGREALRISVFVGLFASPACRAPVSGTVQSAEPLPGAFVNARQSHASSDNSRHVLQIDTAQGQRVTCVLVAGALARNVQCYARAGEPLARGQRCGFTPLGSRVDLYLPVTARPRVALGDRVSATSTVLADLTAVLERPQSF